MSTSASNPSINNNQQFCLKWNNHGLNLTRTLTEMASDLHFVDVTLACEGQSIQAHKVVLSACSNYFKELFLQNPCQHPIVILKDIKLDELKGIIDFMYKGEVNVFQHQLGALLKTAEILKVKGLTEVHDEQNKDNNNISQQQIQQQQSEQQQQQPLQIQQQQQQSSSSTSSQQQQQLQLQQQQQHQQQQQQRPKKRRKRVKKHGTTNSNNSSELQNNSSAESGGESASENGAPSSDEEKETANIPRRTVVQTELSNDHMEEDSSEAWTQSAAQDDDLIDVKPIISFDEGNSNSQTDPEMSGGVGGGGGVVGAGTRKSLAEWSESGKICVCHLCHLTFTAYSSLRRHMQRHYADRERYECDICLKSYSRKDYLKEHKKLKHAVG